ncbi:hypothetical protein BCR35DRAFT_310754 [Leucosporidium creatinivorum]|uniref:Pyridoxamine 5'-phosphate oxidase Alr4036 family FMN-binding domain-containing protein n=1 Tax=Leucosporidium creatinivorum TaxID=106004 RepID=A0A1Y2CV38_9BASI|nr:hypothetical protein BCR35DRAFT_310754 [Leucosporidium creatinivorum]
MPKGSLMLAITKAAGSPSEYVFWASPTGDQIRVRGLVHLYTPSSPASEQSVASLLPDLDWEAFRLEQWKGLSSHLRATFVHEAPGEPVDDDHEEEVERLEVGDEKEEAALKRFCLVVFEPRRSIGAKPPNRFTWTLEDNGSWTKQRVAV